MSTNTLNSHSQKWCFVSSNGRYCSVQYNDDSWCFVCAVLVLSENMKKAYSLHVVTRYRTLQNSLYLCICVYSNRLTVGNRVMPKGAEGGGGDMKSLGKTVKNEWEIGCGHVLHSKVNRVCVCVCA